MPASEKDSFANEDNDSEGDDDMEDSSLSFTDTGDASHNGSHEHEEDEEQDELTRRETIHVFRLRLLVFLVLLLAAVAVSVIVFYITAGAQRKDFKTQYDGAAEKVIEAFHGIVENKLPAVTSLAVAAVAHGIDHNYAWPYVSLSSFQQRAATARAQSGTLYVGISPMVSDSNRAEWEKYVVGEDSNWIQQGLEYQETIGLFNFTLEGRRLLEGDKNSSTTGNSSQDSLSIKVFDYETGQVIDDPGPGPYFPSWTQSPIFHEGQGVNFDLYSLEGAAAARTAFDTHSVVISEFLSAAPGDMNSADPLTAYYSLLIGTTEQTKFHYDGDPLSQVYFPIFNSFEDDRTSVAILTAWIKWSSYFEEILPSNLHGVIVVLSDSCGNAYTYEISGENVLPMGPGDLHSNEYNDMKWSADFSSIPLIPDGTKNGLPLNHQYCRIVLDVYPSASFYSIYKTNTPIIITISVAIIFIFTACMFLLYDRLVERRQALILRKATESHAIVSSLFPENVRERLIHANNEVISKNSGHSRRLKKFLTNGTEGEEGSGLAPIADLFPYCTVLFADIAGFTAWSSTREPAQVFVLLQAIYQAFDAIAKRRCVFKVETIGDSYVAVTGLPEPQPNHAVIMARFAAECKEKMAKVTADLEKTLGPDTGDLTLRFGMHSGPVTAGVLRGERARFQLFGDTVNTASRMESTGMKGKIQVSEATHDLIVEAGKSHWLQPRPDGVKAKGKGIMKTFWLDPAGRAGSTCSSSTSGAKSSTVGIQTATVANLKTNEFILKQDRLVDWMVEMLQEHIKMIMAMRKSTTHTFKETYIPNSNSTPLDEVAEVILLPRYNAKAFAEAQDYRKLTICAEVLGQLREYVSIIASTYHSNHFHNFEHACHVAMATNKFIKRIVSPDNASDDNDDVALTLHSYTHGINSDPLTVLAIVFSALIHDVDHRGVSNTQLAVEQQEMAAMYRNKSVAEQNSLDISWNLLMRDQFEDLRACLFSSRAELMRFRQVLVNVVLATDIFDAELNNLRKNRWTKAFSECDMSEDDKNDLRAIIVIEHIIQASDVSHTMQHWHIYRKWNQRLFMEMYAAFKSGRMTKDPSTFWYQGELGFFDNYIIPLAKKLKECNVFGVSSDECLNYAQQNRGEWAERGQEIVARMTEELCRVSWSQMITASIKQVSQPQNNEAGGDTVNRAKVDSDKEAE